MSRKNIEDLLDRYLKKQTTAKENEQFEEWFAAYDQHDDKLKHLDKDLKVRWLDDLYSDLQVSIAADQKIIVMKPDHKKLFAIISSAAVLLLCLGLLWQSQKLGTWYHQLGLENTQVAANQQREVILDDGSKVIINSGSELEYPKSFDGKTREVYLKGEAYFDIRHNTAKPFMVHTGKVTTTVMGTAFNIKTTQASGVVIVTVDRGKVGMTDGGHLIGYITPGRQIIYDENKQEHIEKSADVTQVLNWRNPEIHFDDTTLGNAAEQLEQRFNTPVNFSNQKLRNCRFSGTIPKGKNLHDVLRIVCAFSNATFQDNKDGSITINGKGCD